MFTVPETGTYKLELWGAQGGSITNTNGGAYTAGEIVLNKDSNLYIYVGEQGNNTRNTAFNGGGKGGATNSSDETFKGSSGGGATDIRLVGGNWDDTASLKSRIMVAAGSGGGTDEVYERAGENSIAGGLTGGTGGYYNGHSYVNQNGKGGTQTAGGAAGNNHFSATGTNNAGTFGVGGNCDSTSDNKGAGGGGGGYFGGGAGGSTLSGGSGQGGGGGSSYISGHTGCVAIASVETITPKVGCTNGTTDITCSYHYSGKRFTNTVMKSGNESMPTHDGTGTMTGNTGNGYAKITYLGN